jgi:hypothetical protein
MDILQFLRSLDDARISTKELRKHLSEAQKRQLDYLNFRKWQDRPPADKAEILRLMAIIAEEPYERKD